MIDSREIIASALSQPITEAEKDLAARIHNFAHDHSALLGQYSCTYYNNLNENNSYFDKDGWADPNYERCVFVLKARALLSQTGGDLEKAYIILDIVFKYPVYNGDYYPHSRTR